MLEVNTDQLPFLPPVPRVPRYLMPYADWPIASQLRASRLEAHHFSHRLEILLRLYKKRPLVRPLALALV